MQGTVLPRDKTNSKAQNKDRITEFTVNTELLKRNTSSSVVHFIVLAHPGLVWVTSNFDKLPRLTKVCLRGMGVPPM